MQTAAAINETHPVVRENTIVSTSQPIETKQVVADVTPITSTESSVISRPIVETMPTKAVMHAPATVQDQAVVKEPLMQVSEPTIVERTSVRQHPVRSAPQTKADFGWLAQALWEKVVQLKCYPSIAKINH
ncbi:MAG: hypothetical protein C4293_07520 [Nitrospiraceae bacterium]